MARDNFIDNPAEEDKNCSMHNIFTLLQNEEEEEELDVVLASTDSTAAGGAVHVDHADVAYLLQWLTDNTGESWDDDINAIDYHGRSALHAACYSKASWEVINGLMGKLDEKAINAIDKYGSTALHIVCWNGASWEVINGILGKLNEKAINAFEKSYGRNALHYACRFGASWEFINGFMGKLDKKAINAIDKDGWTALHAACYSKASWEVINGLLGKLDEKVINAIDDNGRTALHIACANKASWEVINRLLGKLDKEAINAIDNQDGETAFHYAFRCEASSEVIIGLLGKLDEEAINAIDKFGRSALHNAACKRGASSDVINGLLGNLNEKAINAIDNQDGETALHNACRFGASEVINAIVTHTHGKKLSSIKNFNSKLPFDIFPDDWEARNEHLKNLLKLHDIMEMRDPCAFSYPDGLLQSIFYLPPEYHDEFEFMNHSYFRGAINAKITQTFSLSILFLDVAVQGLVMAVFSFTINGAVKELPTTSMAGLIPCLLWLLFREIVQYQSTTAEFYFGDAANFVDIIQIVLVIAVLLISFIGKGTIDEGLLVACIGVAWTRLIFVISNLNYSLALFVAALLQVSSSCYIEFTILAMM
jgi:ankyrin repeat protein